MDARLFTRLLPALCLGLAASVAAADPALVTATGHVEIGHGQPPAWRAARGGDELAFGDAVRTGADGRAELALGDGRIVRVYERSLLRIGTETTPTGAARSVSLDQGTSLFDILRKAVTDEFEVQTPEIIVSVKGTRFLVAAVPGPDYTSVFRGTVELAGPGFEDVAVHAGFTGASGEVLVDSFEDPWNGWEKGAAAPEPALDSHRDAEVKGAIDTARSGDPSQDKGGKSGGEHGNGKGAVETVVAATTSSLDPVADVARKNAEHGNSGKGDDGNGNGSDDSLLDTVLASKKGDLPDGGGSGGSGAPFPFTFDVTTSGGPNTVTVGFGNKSVTLDQSDVDALLQGSQAPLGNLNSVVNSLGVDRAALAQYLAGLL